MERAWLVRTCVFGGSGGVVVLAVRFFLRAGRFAAVAILAQVFGYSCGGLLGRPSLPGTWLDACEASRFWEVPRGNQPAVGGSGAAGARRESGRASVLLHAAGAACHARAQSAPATDGGATCQSALRGSGCRCRRPSRELGPLHHLGSRAVTRGRRLVRPRNRRLAQSRSRPGVCTRTTCWQLDLDSSAERRRTSPPASSRTSRTMVGFLQSVPCHGLSGRVRIDMSSRTPSRGGSTSCPASCVRCLEYHRLQLGYGHVRGHMPRFCSCPRARARACELGVHFFLVSLRGTKG